MASEEISTLSSCPCLCGKGKILHQASVPNHGWSSGSYTFYTLECADCAREWEVQSSSLVNSAEYKRRMELSSEIDASSEAIRALMKPHINSFFGKMKHMNKQRQAMIGYRLGPPSLPHYRQAIGMGKTPADICHLPGDVDWLRDIAPDLETKAKLEELITGHIDNLREHDTFEVRTVKFPDRLENALVPVKATQRRRPYSGISY